MTKQEPWTPTQDDRVNLAGHLVYEVEATFLVAGRLLDTAGTVPDWTPRNAEVEALAMHVRLLIDFFWRDRERIEKYPDAFAADYFDNGRWASLRPERPEVLDTDLHDKVGWGVVHLSYRRAWCLPEQRQWPTIRMARALAPAVLCFGEHVDPAKLGAGAVERMRRSAASFLDLHGAP